MDDKGIRRRTKDASAHAGAFDFQLDNRCGQFTLGIYTPIHWS